MASSDHPLAGVLRDATAGCFPPVDGTVEVVPPDPAGQHAVVEFTGHAYVLTDRPATDPIFDGVDAFGGATQAALLVELAGPSGTIGSLDVVLVRRAGPSHVTPLPAADDVDRHPRVLRARVHRRDVQAFADERGLACIGRGLADRVELSVELTGAAPGRGAGRSLIEAALANVDADTHVFAQVASGNAASLRAFLACGFMPIGCEVLIDRV
ncbi:MAG: hypothetical protein QNJ12_22115 [Ilumatobacter sp.]|uniref:hypothetical protein n=1 Tax=Ilumatobacter sp. TaxID=1967498 RepID=UPI0026067F24|nr:hypothetical protein [Ilumatobacter sp.]MDJ0771498.1 hypothetical protein [Ilumatobacter sp.]